MVEDNNIIELDIDEAQEITFKVNITGPGGGTADVRLVCEGDDGLSYVFNDKKFDPESGNVIITVPKMLGKLSEGVKQGQLEVLVDDKRLVPLSFNMEFKKRVVVEAAVSVAVKKKHVTPVSVAATIEKTPIVEKTQVKFAMPEVKKNVQEIKQPKLEKKSSLLHQRWIMTKKK